MVELRGNAVKVNGLQGLYIVYAIDVRFFDSGESFREIRKGVYQTMCYTRMSVASVLNSVSSASLITRKQRHC